MKKWLLLLCLSFSLGACTPKSIDISDNSLYKYNKVLPLDVGTSWQYTVTRYDGYNSDDFLTATSTITDTITHSEANQNYWVATIQSEQSLESLVEVHGNYSVSDNLQPAFSKNYWFIVDGNRVLRQETSLNLADLQAHVLVEFSFPMSIGEKWSMGNAKDAPMDRSVKKQGSITVPAGQFSNCFYLEGVMGGTTFEDWFCPGIGIVWSKIDHHGTPSSYTKELLSYSVKQ